MGDPSFLLTCSGVFVQRFVVSGEADVESIARQVFRSEGPSGTNREYVYKLAAAMREIAPHVRDDHLFRLEEALQRMESQSRIEM